MLCIEQDLEVDIDAIDHFAFVVPMGSEEGIRGDVSGAHYSFWIDADPDEECAVAGLDQFMCGATPGVFETAVPAARSDVFGKRVPGIFFWVPGEEEGVQGRGLAKSRLTFLAEALCGNF